MSFIECDFALLMTFLHGLNLLTNYGVKSFYLFFKSYIENSDGSKSGQQTAKLKSEMANNKEMTDYYDLFKQNFDNKLDFV
jgi:hypothetical protein